MLCSPIATSRERFPAIEPAGRLTGHLERRFFWVVLVLLGAFTLEKLPVLLGSWQTLSGAETEWVATALAAGHGYSFDGTHHWLFDPSRPDQFYPTAWTDPLYTFLYAGLILIFGDHSRLAASLLSLGFVLATATLVAGGGKRLAGPWAGLVALLALLFAVRNHAFEIVAAPMGALWAALLLFTLVGNIRHMDLWRSVCLGAILGLSILTTSSFMIFLPLIAVLIVFMGPARGAAVRHAATVALTAILLVSPWTIRNYAVFDTVVPVRTGLGQIAQAGTVALVQTYSPETAGARVPAPWRSAGPAEAVRRSSVVRDDRIALLSWQREEMKATFPGGATLNEAQKDKLLLENAKRFAIAHPILTIHLAALKEMRFVLLSGRGMAVLTIFAGLVCTALAFRQRLLIVPLALAAAYVAPFAIIVPYFYRYRYPIEPAIAVLAGVAVAHVAQAVLGRVVPGQWRPGGGRGARRAHAAEPGESALRK